MSLLQSLLCRMVLHLSVEETGAVVDYMRMADQAIVDGKHRERRRQLEQLYVEAQRVCAGGDVEEGFGPWWQVVVLLQWAGVGRWNGPSFELYGAGWPERLRKQYLLEIMKINLGAPSVVDHPPTEGVVEEENDLLECEEEEEGGEGGLEAPVSETVREEEEESVPEIEEDEWGILGEDDDD